MLKFKMIEKNDDIVTYRYWPEQDAEYGEVTAKTKDGELVSMRLALEDEFKTYAFHMLSRIRKFAKDKSFDEDGMIAWY